MINGYFKLQRRFFDHWLWSEKRCLSKAEAWLDLLQIAAFTPTKRIVRDKLLMIEEGEVIASLRYLAERWDWNKDKVSGFLKLLESEQMIRREMRQGESVIIICKYKDYARIHDTESDRRSDSGLDTLQTDPRQNLDKYKEGEEGVKGGGGERTATAADLSDAKPFNPNRMTTFAEVLKFAASQPLPIPTECCEAFFDRMESEGWITPNGHPLADWRARFRSWATNWANNSASNGQRRAAK
jgi:hypothetical protein